MMTFKPAVLALVAFTAICSTGHAQDKFADEKNANILASYKTEQSLEEQFHTTDCSKMPTYTYVTQCSDMHSQVKTIQLKNTTSASDANEILITVRNMTDPTMKIYLNTTQQSITIKTYPEEIARIEALIRTLDVPQKNYRVNYTIAESDNGKRLGIEHFSVVVASGQRVGLKQGSKIPIATGTSSDGGKGTVQQFTYLDVGINIDSTVDPIANGLHLKSKVEESSVGDSQNMLGVSEPIIRQSVLESVSNLTFGKPVALGQIDIPGSTRHLDIEVVAELIP